MTGCICATQDMALGTAEGCVWIEVPVRNKFCPRHQPMTDAEIQAALDKIHEGTGL